MTAVPSPASPAAAVGAGRLVVAIRVTCVVVALVSLAVLGRVGYLLWYTDVVTARAQDAMFSSWGPDDPEAPGAGSADAALPAVAAGDPFALLWFTRSGERILHPDPLVVVEGTGDGELRRGPGHYTATGGPGEPGTMGIAGHRTTFGAHFAALDTLVAGDEIHVVDRAGAESVYRVTRQEVVAPDDVWVLGPDPLGTGRPTLVLTTCHPRHSDRQRLVAFAELV